MELSFACPACHALHLEPADAAFVLSAICFDCELEARYHDELETLVVPVLTAA